MFIQRKNYLNYIQRFRVSEGRDLDNGLRLDRNEKVGIWPKNMMKEIFNNQPNWFLSAYPESSKLYNKICQYNNIKIEQLTLSSGIDGGIKSLYEIMTEPGDLVGVLAPTYAMYKVYATLFQVNLEEIIFTEDLKFNKIDFDKFLAKRPTMFFLPNPNQPVESYFNLKELEEIAKKLLSINCLFVIDEAYHMYGSETGIPLINKYENVVIARTFSKGFGLPSIRLGYLISNSDNINLLSKTRLAHESNSLTNVVAEYVLDNIEIVNEYNKKVLENREYTKSFLEKNNIQAYGNYGNYLLLDLENELRAIKFVENLKRKKIYIKGPFSDKFSKYVLITIGPKEDMERFYIEIENMKLN